MMRPTPALLVTLVAALTACAGGEQLALRSPSPSLPIRSAARLPAPVDGDPLLAHAAWERAGRSALGAAVPMAGGFRERLAFPRDAARAIAWQLELAEGQRLECAVEPEVDASPWSMVLFEAVQPDSFVPVLRLGPDSLRTTFAAPHAGRYVLRLQPEPRGGGSYRVSVHGENAIAFPLPGYDVGAIRSPWGSARDRGARSHQGVDIFAPRGTFVTSVADAVVTEVETTPAGGKVIWARDAVRDLRYYYAHLDAQLVRPGARIFAGDTIGRVGNTGNARRASPHLHFAIYLPDMRTAIDPTPALAGAALDLPDDAAGAELLGVWARTRGTAVRLRAAPNANAEILAELDRGTEVRVLGLVRDWHRVELADGRAGFIAARLLQTGSLATH